MIFVLIVPLMLLALSMFMLAAVLGVGPHRPSRRTHAPQYESLPNKTPPSVSTWAVREPPENADTTL